jgi:aldehyde dehydrogenase (NAD+)
MTLADPPLSTLPPPGLLIGADRVEEASGGVHQHIYAASGRPTAEVVLAGPAEIDRAVAQAREALPLWRRMPADRRRDVLLRLADLILEHDDELGLLQTLEVGAPRQFSRRMPAVAADHLRYAAGWLDKIGGEVVPTWPERALDYTVDEPYGVIGLIIPWNGALVSMAQCLGPILAAGNAAVVKPPELAPFVALRLGALALEAGLPAGLVNVAPGDGVAGAALAGHPGVDKVLFTGSADTGRKVLTAAAAHLTPVSLELGGKSAHVIFGDADLRFAARLAMTGAVALSGQTCAAGTRILVHASVYDEVVGILTSRLGKVAVGDPMTDRTVMGPVVSEPACTRILRIVEDARDSGAARLLTGGHRLGGALADGYFIAPTVFVDVDPDTALAQEEIFGPVLSVFRFETEEEAVRLADGTRHGLGAYLHTNDLRRAHRVSHALTAGSVWVNGAPPLVPSAPFGGTKQSGYGRIGGIAGIREFLRPKNVWIAL